MASLKKIVTSAEKLANLRKLIEEKELEIKPLKIERDKTQELLIADMHSTGLKSVKVKSGESYTMATRSGITVNNEIQAFKWAYDNKAVTIDMRMAGQVIKEMPEPPPGFAKVESEYIRVTKPKE